MRLGQYTDKWCHRTLEPQSLLCDETISASSSLNVLAALRGPGTKQADGSRALRCAITALPCVTWLFPGCVAGVSLQPWSAGKYLSDSKDNPGSEFSLALARVMSDW